MLRRLYSSYLVGTACRHLADLTQCTSRTCILWAGALHRNQFLAPRGHLNGMTGVSDHDLSCYYAELPATLPSRDNIRNTQSAHLPRLSSPHPRSVPFTWSLLLHKKTFLHSLCVFSITTYFPPISYAILYCGPRPDGRCVRRCLAETAGRLLFPAHCLWRRVWSSLAAWRWSEPHPWQR